MRWSDIRPGVVVYPTLMTHWGRGVVERIVHADPLELMFERGGPRRVKVSFEDGKMRTLRATELRKTPNKKKMKEMESLYRSRGTPVEVTDTRLIIRGGK